MWAGSLLALPRATVLPACVCVCVCVCAHACVSMCVCWGAARWEPMRGWPVPLPPEPLPDGPLWPFHFPPLAALWAPPPCCVQAGWGLSQSPAGEAPQLPQLPGGPLLAVPSAPSAQPRACGQTDVALAACEIGVAWLGWARGGPWQLLLWGGWAQQALHTGPVI